MAGIRTAFDVGRNEFEVTGFQSYFRKIVIDYDDLDATAHTLDIVIQAGTLVRSVSVLIATAFAGGTPAIDVGDGTTADGFIDSTATADIDPTTLNAYANSAGIAANAFAAGKYYSAAGVVRFTGSANLTAGKAILLVECLNFADNWRQAGDIGQNG